MHGASLSLCSGIALRLLQLLSREEPPWDLPFLAFFVEVLDCLDLCERGDSILEMMSKHLQSKCRQRRRLALRGLEVLSKFPSMARPICSQSQSLLELLGDADEDVVGMSLSVLKNVLQNKYILISSTTAPKLAQALLRLFNHVNSQVQLLSLYLFCKVMDLVVAKGKKLLKSILCQSLCPLLFHYHDENQHVAEVSRETLLHVTKFLKRRDLKQLVEKDKMLKFAECLVRTLSGEASTLRSPPAPALSVWGWQLWPLP
ncbi:uncharacterized protein LOC111921974, partial [Cyanistes caeruleus]|uniref:uncharacterized protein LOC111921974 n=1 Tax=Cyanistes caeruleus TaxID=156563 RepID=UPI000CDA54E6